MGKKQLVWGLYENHPGLSGKLVGLFSTVDLARNCTLIQPLLISPWHRREAGHNSLLWLADAIDPEQESQEPFYFSVEEIQIDRLAQPDFEKLN